MVKVARTSAQLFTSKHNKNISSFGSMMKLFTLGLLENLKNLNYLRPFVKSRLISTLENEPKAPRNNYTQRSHTCGELTKCDLGKRVTLYGWVQYTRLSNKFIILRDSYGVTQCIVDTKQGNQFAKMKIRNESVLKVEGIVRARPEGQENEKLSTGSIEVIADRVEFVSNARKDLPILGRDQISQTSNNRLKFRYLDLRSQHMQHALRFRSTVCKIFRNKLHDLDFVECETPTLFNRTPGGANEFIVPTQTKDHYYSLVQSPQQLKQLLMIGGLDRYFQISRCYRDERGRFDRQPEFTQIDIELSFTSQDLVMKLINDLIYDLTTKISNESLLSNSYKETLSHLPEIERISFQEAMDRYGIDKPDLRFDWLIHPSERGGLEIEVPFVLEESKMFKIIDSVRERMKEKSSPEEPPIVEFRILPDSRAMKVQTQRGSLLEKQSLGLMRLSIADELRRQRENIFKKDWKFVWVTDFPLFTSTEEGRLEPTHHPFTAPTQDTIYLLEKDPLSVKGQHFDLVLNGQEIAGGSVRIHDAELQRRIFTDVLKVDESRFKYFLEALNSGCPPHGGIAIGLDRLVATLLERDSIMDVIAFPKTSAGRDLMTNCPQTIDVNVKNLYHIK